ncbi:uncharacterized protein SPPG_03844 [Spizellomyces punctatus DAOM BR117]|uniref:DNA polymerase delta subunit 4 n=1 Tax=Spizellomyces punctatus (strain DAOM BR117) TaxID=645134 RepID=A0A0L0HI02_SPIPD|nr:uncharacterized protein SPPG_03844 [Spizellomyces punctatus DAOM BR117]KND00728.1 hypothetical protein SPPG_03844 [Spizellomyces punctatus DAOM BR117]|eukprot:XP_016608767.1 hypothetical protein SPPG_03844 [Spizellomyces punctatus DAOM BR117]
MTSRGPRARSSKSTPKATTSSPTLTNAFTQRKLTDFKKKGKKIESETRKSNKRNLAEAVKEVVLQSEEPGVKVARLELPSESEESVPIDLKTIDAEDNEIPVLDASSLDPENENESHVEIPDRIRSLVADKPAVLEILKDFDLNYNYGPCVGLSRMERWERAQKLELDPPEDIRLILLTPEARQDEDLRQPLWHNDL